MDSETVRDLVKRLRAVPGPTLLTTYPAQTTPDPLSNKAADAIERLTRERDEAVAEKNKWWEAANHFDDEANEQLWSEIADEEHEAAVKARAECTALRAEVESAIKVCDSYADENQRIFDRAEAAEAERDALLVEITEARQQYVDANEARIDAEVERDALRAEVEGWKAAAFKADGSRVAAIARADAAEAALATAREAMRKAHLALMLFATTEYQSGESHRRADEALAAIDAALPTPPEVKP